MLSTHSQSNDPNKNKTLPELADGSFSRAGGGWRDLTREKERRRKAKERIRRRELEGETDVDGWRRELSRRRTGNERQR